MLGRVRPELFPSIFGPNEDEPLDVTGARAAFEHLLEAEIRPFFARTPGGAGAPASIEEAALGFIQVANEAMCRPIREMTQMRGHDASAHVLACFGGAGGQHACAVARALGMRHVFVHRQASILSAVGISLADVVVEAQEAAALTHGTDDAAARCDERHAQLETQLRAQLGAQGFAPADIKLERFLNLR